jgi:uncharacterized membrane protein
MIYIKNKDLKLTFNQSYESIKRILGLVWIALALAAAYFASSLLVSQICIWKTRRFSIWHHHLFILTPLIVLGLGTFGYYALMGDYDDNK